MVNKIRAVNTQKTTTIKRYVYMKPHIIISKQTEIIKNKKWCDFYLQNNTSCAVREGIYNINITSFVFSDHVACPDVAWQESPGWTVLERPYWFYATACCRPFVAAELRSFSLVQIEGSWLGSVSFVHGQQNAASGLTSWKLFGLSQSRNQLC